MKNVQSLERAMLLLSLLDSMGGEEGIGVGEVAKLAGLKSPTAHNLLQTLLQLGYVEQGEHCLYRLAEKAKWLGWDAPRKNQLRQLAQTHLMHLAYKTGETVILTARSGSLWQTIVKIESSHMLTARPELPVTDNFFISATGRCILSNFSTKELQDFVSAFRLPTAKEWPGAATFEDLQKKLEKIRSDRCEILSPPNSGITGIGAVIERSMQTADGAIGVIVPDSRFCKEHKKTIIESILLASRNIGRQFAQ